MVEKILNNTTPYGKIRASHEGSLHSSTLNRTVIYCFYRPKMLKTMKVSSFLNELGLCVDFRY